MDPTPGIASPGSNRRLTLAQKCDLAGQAVAAIITSGLIAAPFLTGTTKPQPRLETVMVVSAPATLPVVVQPQMPVASVPPARRQRIPSSPSKATLAADAVPETVSARSEIKKESGRKALGRRIAGLFVGDGSIPIRPFPTIPQ